VEDAGSAVTDALGVYKAASDRYSTGSPFGRGLQSYDTTCMKGSNPKVTRQFYSRYRHGAAYRFPTSTTTPTTCGAVTTDSPRQWLHISKGKQVWTYDLTTFANVYNSVDYSVDCWITFRTDPRRGVLWMLGRTNNSPPYTFSVWSSEDAGVTGNQEVTVSANSSALERSSERGRLIWVYGDSSDNVFVRSKDTQDASGVFGTAQACMFGGSQLVATVHDLAEDPRVGGLLILTCTSGTTDMILVSEDLGLTWEQVL